MVANKGMEQQYTKLLRWHHLIFMGWLLFNPSSFPLFDKEDINFKAMFGYFRVIITFLLLLNFTSGMLRSSRQGLIVPAFVAPLTHPISRSFHTNSIPVGTPLRASSGFEIPTRQLFRWNIFPDI